VSDKATLRAEAALLQAFFINAGAVPVEADLLLPAEVLLDLYGEDIRARAYVTDDPDRGEMMLRPDFTVPVVQRHMEEGAEPARYTYLGEVFRKQSAGSGRPSEYLQVGFELFDRANPTAADAEVFALFSRALADLNLRAVTGDMGILLAAVDTLSTTTARKAALRRHVWRPRRFRALLDRFTGKTPVTLSRQALLDDIAAKGIAEMMETAGPGTGLRRAEEVATRLAALEADHAAPPLAMAEAEALGELLALRETMPNALAQLGNISVDLPGIASAVKRLSQRAEALDAAGIDAETLRFEASYGRTTMEYYDGFVFGFLASGRPDLPPIATGGRYDALTRGLGDGEAIPAVGGVIRPELVLALNAGGGE